MASRIVRAIDFSVAGATFSLVALTVYLGIVGEALLLIGVPPHNWLGSDYTDARGAVASSSVGLTIVGLMYFAAGRAFRRHLEQFSRLDSFSLCNPLWTAFGGFISASLLRNLVQSELTSGAMILVVIAWPAFWHLAHGGYRQASWARALVIASAYGAALFVIATVQVYRVYGPFPD